MLRINSKEVKENDTFLALKGVKKDGHDYIEEAIKNGASKIICEHGKYSVETIIVPSTREYLSNYLKDKIDLSKVIMIGITGTNGKTTSAYLTYQLPLILGKAFPIEPNRFCFVSSADITGDVSVKPYP